MKHETLRTWLHPKLGKIFLNTLPPLFQLWNETNLALTPELQFIQCLEITY